MTQKWNLQDIRPTSSSKPALDRRPSVEGDQRRVRMEGRRSDDGSTAIPVRAERAERPLDMSSERPTRVREPEIAPTHFAEEDEDERIPVVDGNKRSQRHWVIGVGVFVGITVIGIVISTLTGGATLTLHPKEREINVNAEFTAYKEQRVGELSYEILTLEATSERQVEANGQEEVKVQATGEIEITKTTPGAERLIKNTRFATLDGLVFRIEESVVVPGAVTGSDGKSVPGTIRAKVFADEAGEKYNLKAGTKLVVPGFKEGDYMDLYNAITATNANEFTNGFAGQKFIINDEQLATARQSLQTELRNTLLERSTKERPAGVTTFPGAIAITYTELPAVQYGDNLVTIKEQATLQMPIFSSKDFASFIASETIVGYDGSPVRIVSTDALTFSYSDATTSQSVLANLDSLSFKITGTPHVVWTYDEGKLKLDLLGKEKTAIPQVLGAYRGIEKSEVEIRPVWKRTMPENQDDITIVEVLGDKTE